MATGRSWGNRRITPAKAQHAIDALMALVETGDWAGLDPDVKTAINDACEALTAVRESTRI